MPFGDTFVRDFLKPRSVSWAVSTEEDVVCLKLLFINLPCFGVENLKLIALECLVCHTRSGNALHKECCSFCLTSYLASVPK